MHRGVVFAVGLALLVAESAVAADGLLPGSQAPEVELPQVDLPLPEAQLPSLPIPVPTVAPPAAPPAPASAAPVATTGSSSRPAPRLPGSPRPARGGSAPAMRTSAGHAPAAARAPAIRGGVLAAKRPARRERRLRRTVTRLRGCLDGLGAAERRVLVLRSGLGPRPARSRARVARALGVSARRVARLERRGLRRLRGLARDGCGGATAPAPATTGYAPTSPALAPAALAAAGDEPDRVEVKGTRESGSGEREPSPGGEPPALAPPASKPAAPPPAAVVRRGAERGSDLTLPLLAAAALLGIALAVRAARRSLRA